jgi:hypothetical protein
MVGSSTLIAGKASLASLPDDGVADEDLRKSGEHDDVSRDGLLALLPLDTLEGEELGDLALCNLRHSASSHRLLGRS